MEKLLGFDESFFVTEKYLQVKYPEPEKRIFITCPEFSSNRKCTTTNKRFTERRGLVYENELIASYINLENLILARLKNV